MKTASDQTRIPSTAEAEKSFGLDASLNKLESALSFFDADDAVDQVHEYVDDFVLAERQFAEMVKFYWIATAPWNTTNLEQSIKIDDEENYPKEVTIGVDVDALTAHAGRYLPSVRAKSAYPKGAWDPDQIPNYDYTEEANKHNVSARRNPGAAPSGGEFIMSVWFEYFKKAKKEVFG